MRNIIDVHCHVYPDKLAPKAVDATLKFYQIERALCKGTFDDLMEENARAQITYHVIHSAATKPEQVRKIDDFIAGCVARAPEHLIGFGTLHQDSQDMAGDVAYAVEKGFRGVKIHPDMQGVSMLDDRSMRMFDACRGKLIVLFHAGDDRYEYSNPEELIPVLQAFPDVTFIGGHLASYRIWDSAVRRLAGQFENLYVDCSSTFFLTGLEKARDMIRAFGADRVLFGTDYPIWNPRLELEKVLQLELTEQERSQILWDNAARLLGLPAGDA